jgi:bacterioferritin-associated ferredoxin
MIVCLCRAKNERDVLRAIEAGAETLSDLQECGIGTDCGGCHGFLRGMLAANESTPPAPFVPMPSTASCAEKVA